MHSHIECREDEIFVGNTESNNQLLHLLGKVRFRLGEQAYDVFGQKIDKDYQPVLSPLFIHVDSFEKYNQIMVKLQHE